MTLWHIWGKIIVRVHFIERKNAALILNLFSHDFFLGLFSLTMFAFACVSCQRQLKYIRHDFFLVQFVTSFSPSDYVAESNLTLKDFFQT